MIKQIKAFSAAITEFGGESALQRARRLQAVVGREIPSMRDPRKRRQLMEQEGRLREILHESKLSERTSWVLARGQSSSEKLRRGAYKARGCRAPGAGRKNPYLKLWEQVKVWHSLQRLQGLQVTEDQIGYKFMDTLDHQLEIHEKVHQVGKLAPEHFEWLKQMRERRVGRLVGGTE